MTDMRELSRLLQKFRLLYPEKGYERLGYDTDLCVALLFQLRLILAKLKRVLICI